MTPPSEEFDLQKTADMTDFLGLNPVPGYKPPTLKQPSMGPTIPEQDDLYAVQNNLLRSLQALDRLMEDNPDMHWTGLQHHLRQTYKTLNRWLTNHA